MQIPRLFFTITDIPEFKSKELQGEERQLNIMYTCQLESGRTDVELFHICTHRVRCSPHSVRVYFSLHKRTDLTLLCACSRGRDRLNPR